MVEQLLVILGVVIFGIQHSGVSTSRIKHRIIDRFGKKGYSKIFSITSVIVLVISFLLLNYWDWLYFITNPELVNPLLFVPAILLILIGLVIASMASREISVSTVADMRTDRKPELISSGIYAKVRHPLYLATILLFLGLALMYPFLNIIIYAISMSVYIIVGAYLEERKLIDYYDQEYLKYKESVGFLLPKISSKSNEQPIQTSSFES
jgi:protein-S-isoprenylcysteine O-methyltransferase Ste14